MAGWRPNSTPERVGPVVLGEEVRKAVTDRSCQ
jgi:hypothetical protein